ncbi:hypothetical protein ERW49_02625 [Aliivibrio finisterrensis]|uniref:Uncharacterized protein n=1 Tax=Aliivibrio finisterrensis TaxID=511998 RepID=A0A4Q5KPY3_9GAMM|nr:hypothetical protein [Aliivibrio finisterrensis]RYU47970.1 hypothetical protein ERW49_02625 [Aliivibrio finisterrensis]
MKITLPDEKYGSGNDCAVSGEGTPVCQTEIFDLGWMQADKTQTQEELFSSLYTEETLDKHKALIKKYNTHLNEPVRQGEMIILLTMEPVEQKDINKLIVLKEECQVASEGLCKLTEEQLQVHQTYFEVIENKLIEYWNTGMPTDGFAYMGTAIGTVAPAMKKNLENVSSTLAKLDELYLKMLSKKLDRSSFTQQRQALKEILDKQLDKLTQKTLNIPVNKSIKKTLGVHSTKSLIHNADEILKEGSVSELGKRIANTAKWIKHAESAGNVAVGLSVMSGVYNVTQNCDGLESCTRNIAIETGGVVGGWAGGTAGAAIAGGFIALIGVSSAPIVMIIVGGSALGLGIFGAGAGKDMLEEAYEFFELDLFFEQIESSIDKDIPNDIEDYINKSTFNNFNIKSNFNG